MKSVFVHALAPDRNRTLWSTLCDGLPVIASRQAGVLPGPHQPLDLAEELTAGTPPLSPANVVWQLDEAAQQIEKRLSAALGRCDPRISRDSG